MTLRKAASLLLVDDDPSLLKLLGMRLTSEGFRVTTAESGAEALRLLHRERIDLVLSDLRMDGEERIIGGTGVDEAYKEYAVSELGPWQACLLTAVS